MPPTDWTDPTIPARHALYLAIVHQIEREDGLINYRLSWMLVLNGFLFSASALMKCDSPAKDLYPAIPWVGLLVSAAALVGVIAADRQIAELMTCWITVAKCGAFGKEWPRPFGDWLAAPLGKAPAYIPPIALCVAWGWYLCLTHGTGLLGPCRPG